MKRPLCLLALIITAIVYLYLFFFFSGISDNDYHIKDGNYTEIVGVVSDKGYRLDYFGNPSPVVYVIPSDNRSNKLKYVQCYMSSEDYREPAIGETVKICGTIATFPEKRNPGEFDSRLYYSTLKISYRIKNARISAKGGKPAIYRETMYQIKSYLEKVLDNCLMPEDSAVMKAVLLGDKSSMSDDIKDLYKANGISHILAVSGLHISIIGMGLYGLLRRLRLGNLISMALSVLFMYSYGVMCGMGSSSFRAICMFFLRVAAPVVGRTYDILSALSLAEILLLIDQPLYLYNSGFLFSFGAVIGITVVSPCLELMGIGKGKEKMVFAKEEKEKKKELSCKVITFLTQGLKSGVAIALVTLPVYSLFYYTYPVHSLVLNLAVIPLMGLLMTAGLLCLLLGSVWNVLGIIPGKLVHIILTLYKMLCSSGKIIGKFTWYMGHSDGGRVIMYLLILTCFIILSDRMAKRFKKDREKRTLSEEKYTNGKWILADLLRISILVTGIFVLTFQVKSPLELDFIDVGQGDGIVVSQGDKSILIDGGSSSKKEVGRYQIIPFLKYRGIGELEAIVVTHEDEDHISGIKEILEETSKGGISVGKLILPEVAQVSKGDNYKKLEEIAGEWGIPVLYINSGENFNLGKAEFFCLNPKLSMVTEGANEYSTVLFMEYNGFKALFTGDMEGEGQRAVKELISDKKDFYKNINLLKVAHHGSMYTTDEEFLDMVRPQIAVISCGVDNSYGHPHRELLERLDGIGAMVYRTDRSGCIRVFFSGNRVRVSLFLTDKNK